MCVLGPSNVTDLYTPMWKRIKHLTRHFEEDGLWAWRSHFVKYVFVIYFKKSRSNISGFMRIYFSMLSVFNNFLHEQRLFFLIGARDLCVVYTSQGRNHDQIKY